MLAVSMMQDSPCSVSLYFYTYYRMNTHTSKLSAIESVSRMLSVDLEIEKYHFPLEILLGKLGWERTCKKEQGYCLSETKLSKVNSVHSISSSSFWHTSTRPQVLFSFQPGWSASLTHSSDYTQWDTKHRLVIITRLLKLTSGSKLTNNNLFRLPQIRITHCWVQVLHFQQSSFFLVISND